VGTGVEADAILESFDAGGIRGELSSGGLEVDILLGVLPPFCFGYHDSLFLSCFLSESAGI
jgi:hypothetical protein